MIFSTRSSSVVVRVVGYCFPLWRILDPDLEIILSFLAAWLAYQKISAKKISISREKIQNNRRNCIKIDLSYKYSKKLMENFINYNILQIIWQTAGDFLKHFCKLEKFLAARLHHYFHVCLDLESCSPLQTYDTHILCNVCLWDCFVVPKALKAPPEQEYLYDKLIFWPPWTSTNS